MDFTTRLEEMLNKRQITKIAFLSDLGYSKNAISEWRKGITRSYMNKIDQIADYLDCSVDYLLGRENKKDAPLPVPMLGKDAQKLLDMYDEMGKESKEQLILYATSLYYVDRANRSAQYSGALAAYEGGTQQHTVSKEAAEKVLRRLDDMEKNT